MIDPVSELAAARAERIRRRAHHVLEGRARSAPPWEAALVWVFAVAQAWWAVAAVARWE